MAKLYRPSFLIISILVVALLMHYLREGTLHPTHATTLVLLFATGLVAGVLLKPAVAN